MRKIVLSIIVISFIAVMSACGESEPENSGATNVNDINLDPLAAELNIPESAEPGDELDLQAYVTQGEEVVDDASEVIFEVWIDSEKSDSVMIEADLPGEEGIYEVSHEFTEEAVYMVQPHVTARGSHVMPVGEIIVGDPVQEETEGEESNDHNHNHNEDNHGHNDANQDHDHGDHSHDHGHLHESLSLDWKTNESASVEEEVSLQVEVEWEEASWVNGEVQFEVWKHGDDRHQWISAEEVEDGLYEAVHEFEEPGEHHIMVHLEDDEIHEHVQYLLEVE
ncbi:hypothetical protein CR194_16355 [Salipaludibacillus keqinensis]|uniref:YtkA-like domain-containing protein n=1 Tax=Salipaludibacillus keqinensis TaxID=2045207 RepID=A0A323TCA8_9BACI|nr:FixH family protein [Salipaludibacillus keqinensis]PYZ92400.1 hypothetical protein CR194_16355 [Salipaludibacillus keqinensis]